MEGVLKILECAPECGFIIRSHDEWEIISAAMTHLKEVHGMEKVGVEDIRSHIEVAQALYGNAKAR